MRRLTFLLAAALAVGTAPVVARGTERPAAPTFQSRLDAWRATRADLARKLPLAEPAGGYDGPPAAQEVLFSLSYLVKAGDLDGDGGEDLVDVLVEVSYDDLTGFSEGVRLNAYRGRDGKVLWTKEVPPSCYAFPVFGPVGAEGKPGVLVVSYACRRADAPDPVPLYAGAGVTAVTLSAYDGAGTAVWERVLGGTRGIAEFTYAGASPVVEGVFDANPGGGADVLVANIGGAEAYSPVDYDYAGGGSTARLMVVDGANGVPREVPGAFASRQYDFWASPVGDLDGDGRADVVASYTDVQDNVVAHAVSSLTGAPLWTRTVGPADEIGSGIDVEVTAVGDATGDGDADVALTVLAYGPSSPVPGSPPAGGGAFTELVDGASGEARWRKPGELSGVAGNADRKAGVELVVGYGTYTSSAVGFAAAAYNASGSRVWSVSRRLNVRGATDRPSVGWSVIGDVHTDGVAELGYGIVVPAGKKTRRDEGAVNGRTGRIIRDPAPDMWLARTALDGRGVDLYTRRVSGNVLTVTAYAGDTGRKLWKAALPGRGTPSSTVGLRADGDRCGDLVVGMYAGAAESAVVLSGATGKPLWQLNRDGNGGATVTKPRARSVTRYRRTC
jgi:hypothetical protein